MTDLHHLTIHEARALLNKGEISSTELTRSCLERIGSVEERVKTFVTVTGEMALEQARRSDERSTPSDPSMPLDGVPMQIKDIMCTRGIPTTCSSRMLEDFVPIYDATAVERLYSRGAVLLGKGEHGRVRHGVLHRELRILPQPEPLEPGQGSRRQQRGRGSCPWRRGKPSMPWVPTPGAA